MGRWESKCLHLKGMGVGGGKGGRKLLMKNRHKTDVKPT